MGSPTSAGVRARAGDAARVTPRPASNVGASRRQPAPAVARRARTVVDFSQVPVRQPYVRHASDGAFGTEGGHAEGTRDGQDLALEVGGRRAPEDALPSQPGGGAPAGPAGAQAVAEGGPAGSPGGSTDLGPAATSGGDRPVATGSAGDAGSGPVPAQSSPAPTLAVPTLALAPSPTLTRGDTLTATIAFTPNAGETVTLSAWRYTTAAHGNVTRASTEPDFQTRWSGTMAQSGTLEVDYAVTPAGGTAGSTQTLTQAVTVNDRTGTAWASSATLNAETPFSGRPTPPRVFSDLGIHNVSITDPVATDSAVSAGPNTGFHFASSVTAGSFVSQPSIHPALTTATSPFNVFHQSPSRLYLVAGTTRTLVPLTAYSGLSLAGGTLTFTVPDWEAFYKARRFYTVTATSSAGSVGTATLRDAWWGLDANAADAGLLVRDDAAIRAALHITATDSYRLSATSVGSWEGFQLMQAAAILTGTRSHEYQHARHSHRANFNAMLRAVDPRRKVESLVGSPTTTVDFASSIAGWTAEILKPNHELVDEAASTTAGAFVAVSGQDMAGVNTDPANGNFLGSVWNISADAQMTN